MKKALLLVTLTNLCLSLTSCYRVGNSVEVYFESENTQFQSNEQITLMCAKISYETVIKGVEQNSIQKDCLNQSDVSIKDGVISGVLYTNFAGDTPSVNITNIEANLQTKQINDECTDCVQTITQRDYVVTMSNFENVGMDQNNSRQQFKLKVTANLNSQSSTQVWITSRAQQILNCQVLASENHAICEDNNIPKDIIAACQSTSFDSNDERGCLIRSVNWLQRRK